ncbi:MAG: phosphatidate cytidylyltransferase [Rhodospirillaceae bacterium]|nr:phosphatidate cytidylyltransferase [Rhodospirillaceae bacterium]
MRSETAQRAITALALAAPAAAALLLGPPLLPVFIGAIAVVMAWEWVRVTGASVFGATGATLAGALVAAVALAAFGLFSWAYGAIGIGALVCYGVARAHAREHGPSIAFGALYIGVPALSLLWLYGRPDYGRDFVVWLICIVIANDVAAYFAGRAIGGPRLAPRISPGKTWAGAVGGVVGALAVGLALGSALDLARLAVLAAGAAAFAAISQIGDLLESGVKRAYRVKDTGTILPGHGGMMDRVDGIVAALAAGALIFWIGGGDPRTWL